MKKYIIPILILFIYACSNPQKKDSSQSINSEPERIEKLTIVDTMPAKVEEVILKVKNGQAVLIGEKIDLLDNKLTVIETLTNSIGQIVKITGISDSLFNNAEDICKSFWYVQIETENLKGLVNGRQLYEIQNSSQDTSILTDGQEIEIKTTNFLGMGVDYQGELMGCPVDQPILLKDTKNDYFGLVYLIQNDYSKKSSWDNEYPYFEIRSDDGCYDKIGSITIEEHGIKIKIHRNYQEGENDFEVLLSFDNGKYTAEFLNFGEIRYE
jgi:hypothetical protein